MRSFIASFVLAAATVSFLATEAFAHGGGCRKSSPKGQCCHADNSNGGKVHCH